MVKHVCFWLQVRTRLLHISACKFNKASINRKLRLHLYFYLRIEYDSFKANKVVFSFFFCGIARKFHAKKFHYIKSKLKNICLKKLIFYKKKALLTSKSIDCVVFRMANEQKKWWPIKHETNMKMLDVRLFNSTIAEWRVSFAWDFFERARSQPLSLSCSARSSRALTEFYISRRTTRNSSSFCIINCGIYYKITAHPFFFII